MTSTIPTSPHKGRLSLSIDQELLDHLKPYKHQSNLSTHAERMFSSLLDELENRAWAERNAEALANHGRDIATTGLAGEEFDRI